MEKISRAVIVCGVLFALFTVHDSAFGQWTRNAGTGETYVTNTGDKIGIGTTTPQSKVHIYSTENFPELKVQTANGDGSPRLVFLHGVMGSATEWRPGFIQSVGNDVNYTGALEFYTNGTGSGNRFGFVRAMTMVNGNVGVGTAGSGVPLSKFHVADGSVLFSGTTGSTPVSGAGTRMMYVPGKAGAFRAGTVYGSEWDDANIGALSFAVGESSTASGLGSAAFGSDTKATANYSMATGYGTIASGSRATAMGHGSIASGGKSVAMGSNATAQPYASLVIGRYNIVSGNSLAWDNSDVLFACGNGASAGARSNAFTVLKNGNTHIGGANPGAYKLYVSGDAYATGSWLSSDARFKTNIVTVDGALAKVMSMHGVIYDFKRDEFKERNLPEGKQLGFIAQELEKVVPEVVKTDTDGYKAVAYQNLTALLTEAIKEQQGTIEGLRTENSQLKARLQAIESRLGIVPVQGSYPVDLK